MMRPAVLRQAPRLIPRTDIRWKSGMYGYTQAKSLVYTKVGNPDEVLFVHKSSISPSIPASQVLLRTLAAPINPADINTIQGTYGVKPAYSSLNGTADPSAIGGNEGVFEVVSAGSQVSDTFKPGDWVIPASSGFGTWRTHALADANTLMSIDKTGLTPTQAATVSVNPSTAYRILRMYGPEKNLRGMTPLEPNSGKWFIQNGANSGVGRAAVQFGKLWGLRSINVIRERDTPEATEALKKELFDLGATEVVTHAEFTSRDWSDRLKSILGKDEIGLGMNCVGGKSLTAMARSMGHGGSIVTYGAMAAREPSQVPAGLMIFKDIRLLGFWLTRWNQNDPDGRRTTINDILEMMRQRRFVDVPYIEQKWDWDTEDAKLTSIVQKGLEGFRGGKGIFMFGDT
ncbi:hypothetical protein TD95_005056 [Thielaviopsis punctulata]|uniref:enoyl-[acyl-carrier-protein] reductase n=1 Tax=Thielaviopsis punctulata TaxID=72032 RepID=A0A0F4ZJW2_9PEZI|nr:hypothetical protein TD95_005056 [Thielaviopsis punctulata]